MTVTVERKEKILSITFPSVIQKIQIKLMRFIYNDVAKKLIIHILRSTRVHTIHAN